VLTSGQNGGKLDEWAHCSSCAVSWSAWPSTAPGRLVLGGSHSGRLGPQRVTSGIRLGATPAVQRFTLLEPSFSSSSSSSFSSRPWSATSGARELPAWEIGTGLPGSTRWNVCASHARPPLRGLRAPASDPQTVPLVLTARACLLTWRDGTHQCALLACVPQCRTANSGQCRPRSGEPRGNQPWRST
jgi:hypothetical protein